MWEEGGGSGYRKLHTTTLSAGCSGVECGRLGVAGGDRHCTVVGGKDGSGGRGGALRRLVGAFVTERVVAGGVSEIESKHISRAIYYG